MTQSNFVNPNGLPADEQITSARDMAILARAVLREFPEYNYYWRLPGIKFGKRVKRNYNTLIGRYPGTDGMKTGFICASGFNVVATATRNGKRLIAVVLGSPSPAVRAVKAAQLFERGFAGAAAVVADAALGQVDALQPINVDPPNLRDRCAASTAGVRRRKRPRTIRSPTSRPIRPTRCSCRRCAAPAPPSRTAADRTSRSASRCASITGPPSAPVDQAPAEAEGQGQRQGHQDREGQEVGRRQSHRQRRCDERADAGALIDRDAGHDRRRPRAGGQEEGGEESRRRRPPPKRRRRRPTPRPTPRLTPRPTPKPKTAASKTPAKKSEPAKQ